MNMTDVSASQLRKAADLKERIEQLNSELSNLLTGISTGPDSQAAPLRRGPGRPPKNSPSTSGASSTPSLSTQNSAPRTRKMSAAGRARIAAAAKARWAKIKASGGAVNLGGSSAPTKRKLSPAARAKMAAAAKARWAKVKTGKA